MDTRRYNLTAMWLHWVIAALIVIQLCLGWYMNEALPDHSPPQAQIRTIHISIGLTILILVLVRIGVRLVFPPPRLPAKLPPWNRLLARASHFLFYLLMLALPLSGWALVSLRPRPIKFWGLPWPQLPFAGQLVGSSRAAHHALSHIHVYILIWIVLLTLALHVAGALYHQFVDSKPVLWRMTGLKPPA